MAGPAATKTCPHCGVVDPLALGAILTTRRASASPPLVHGHGLWKVSTHSSVWFVRSPDKESTVVYARRLARRGSVRVRARRATYVDVEAALAVLAQGTGAPGFG